MLRNGSRGLGEVPIGIDRRTATHVHTRNGRRQRRRLQEVLLRRAMRHRAPGGPGRPKAASFIARRLACSASPSLSMASRRRTPMAVPSAPRAPALSRRGLSTMPASPTVARASRTRPAGAKAPRKSSILPTCCFIGIRFARCIAANAWQERVVWRLCIEAALLQPFYSHGPTAKFAAAGAFWLRHFGVRFDKLAAIITAKVVMVA